VIKTAGAERLGYLPGVDGLRAVSVLAVFLFHAGVLDGGFIGVDVFFVISGFLITALAITEIERVGRLGLGAFWARRARRLLPALMLVCATVLVYSVIEGGAALRRVGRDVTATILYVANWAQIGDGRDYFASYDAPPLLQHAWSLAVEEQFYLVWPLVLTVIVFVLRGRRDLVRPAVAAVAIVAAVASVTAAFWLRSSDASLGRLYFGTDTRAVGLAIGSIAGCWVRPQRVSALKSSIRLDAVGVGGAIVLAVLMVQIDGTERWLYGPGLLAIALASLAVMVAAMGTGTVARVLSAGPLVALGRVSYGFYLWHWPVIVVLDGDRTGLSGPVLGALWLSATAALTAFSWFVIERRAPLPRRVEPRWAVAYALIGVVLVWGALTATAIENDRFRSAEFTLPDVPVATTTTIAAVETPPTSPDAAPMTSTTSTTSTTTTTTTLVVVPRRPLPEGRPLRVMIVGDSVAMSLTSSNEETHDVDDFGSVEVYNAGNLGCPVIEQGEWWLAEGIELRVPSECVGPDRYEDEIEGFQPDLIYALFGWTGGGGGQRLPDGSQVAPCQPEFDQLWLDGYQQLVSRLEQHATVIVSTVAPADIDDDGHELPTRCLNALVEDIDAPVFDYGDWLCPNYDCSPSSDLRADKVHFSPIEPLRRGVLDAILAQVLPIAGY
jgi:peptidoglycan/LPS O-acetylase OafA/YrhL